MVYHLLPIKHFHIIFTIPQELRDWFYYNQKACYRLLFRVAWKTIETIAGGGKTGMVVALHTWGSNLSYHPHVHCIVPAGSYQDGNWGYRQGSNNRFFCDARELRATYKRIFIQYFLELVEYAENFTWEAVSIEKDVSLFQNLQQDLAQSCRKEWTVRIENPVLGTEQIIAYLARYVRRVAITNSRILEVSEAKVKISYKQYHLQKQGKPAPQGELSFDGAAFIHRFAQHIPPSGFHKVRYYGLYAYSNKSLKAEVCQQLQQQPVPIYQKPSTRQLLHQLLGHDPEVCTSCGSISSFVISPLVMDCTKGYHLTRQYVIRPIRAGPKTAPPSSY